MNTALAALIAALLMGLAGWSFSSSAYRDSITKGKAIYFEDIEYRCNAVKE